MCRPLKYGSKEKLEERIEDYFKSCYKIVYDKAGLPVQDPETGEYQKVQSKPFTITGLAHFLDTNRQTLLNYEQKEQFFDTINRAKTRIQAYSEERLFDRDGVNGAKFSLINNWKGEDYADLKNIDHTTKGNEISNLSPEERKQKIKQLQNVVNE